VQFVVAYYIKDAPNWLFWIAVYAISGTLNHSLFLVRCPRFLAVFCASRTLRFGSPPLVLAFLFSCRSSMKFHTICCSSLPSGILSGCSLPTCRLEFPTACT
jgi:hypothetical protein